MATDIKLKDAYYVKITIGSFAIVEDVIYYRSNHKLDYVNKWKWHFEYLAALVKVHNPRKTVRISIGYQDVKVGAEYIEEKTKSLLRYKKAALNRLKKGVENDDLFSFKSTDNETKIKQLEQDIHDLENGVFNYAKFPDYINEIKRYLKLNLNK